jgi:hypothetical protein
MLGDVEKYDMLDGQTALNMPGLQRIFETLLQSGDIAADRKFDANLVTDLSYWEESHPEAALTGAIPAARPAQPAQ